MSAHRFRSISAFAAGSAISLLIVVTFQGWGATAAPGDDDATFVPVPPCRLFDYRPAPDTVGSRTSPLGPAETALQQVTGPVGNCMIPGDATAVSMNVTIVSPTAASYLTVFPANVARPTASSLNWLAGQAATPNKVDVKLSPVGAINLYNKAGSVYVLADVVGFYSPQSLVNLQSQIDAINSGTALVPSGATVTGYALHDTSVVNTAASDDVHVPLPARARVALTDDKVNFALGSAGALDGDPNCTGTFVQPTAPVGKGCIYPLQTVNLERMTGIAQSGLADTGFRLRTFTPAAAIAGADQYIQFSWAYRAP